MQWLSWLLDTRNYMPHGHCYLWQPAVLWLNVGSDGVIALSYFTIPAIIGTYLHRRRAEIRQVWVPVLFASFILLCGFTHTFGVWTAWHPDYRLSGVVKALTAIVSAGTAISLLTVMPRAMVLRTPGQLEDEVKLRTAQLEDANRRLEAEVAARRASEEALRKSKEGLRDADRRKDEFLATLAHELRNPLAPITSSLALMELAAGDARVVQGARDVIARQVVHMVRLIDDLMDVSRITGNRLQLQFSAVTLQQVVAQAVETASPTITAAGHRLTIVAPPHEVTVRGDSARLQQVVVNLLTNSARYTPAGGKIDVEIGVHDGRADLVITDTGEGISANSLPHVFDMFTRVGRDRDKAGTGLGIGLALSRQLVDLHDGTIEAFSDGPGRGSRFSVSLPLLPERNGRDTEVDGAGAGTTADASSTGSLRGRRVLVVDDNGDAAESLAALLQAYGATVAVACDGADALHTGAVFRPDVIFMDLGMPVLDGWDATRHLRTTEWGAHVLMVALSGWAQAEDRERSRTAGFDHHLAKPIEPEVAVRLASGRQ